MAKNGNQLRIIGGEWRGRKLRFPDAPHLRPTPDRVRETLFNWLMPVIHGARCLDLFAGSGALGLEALSRSAAHVTFVDSNRKVTRTLQQHLDTMQANDRAEVMQADSLLAVPRLSQGYDVVFLDPPYHLPLMEKVIPLLNASAILQPHTLLYLEIEKRQHLPDLPTHWQLQKEKTAGEVKYYLFQQQ